MLLKSARTKDTSRGAKPSEAWALSAREHTHHRPRLSPQHPHSGGTGTPAACLVAGGRCMHIVQSQGTAAAQVSRSLAYDCEGGRRLPVGTGTRSGQVSTRHTPLRRTAERSTWHCRPARALGDHP